MEQIGVLVYFSKKRVKINLTFINYTVSDSKVNGIPNDTAVVKKMILQLHYM